MAFSNILHQWQRTTDQFIQLMEVVPEGQRKISGVCGIWNIQQIVAHLAGWQREALTRFTAFQARDTSDKQYDIDQFNADSVAALRLLNWQETLETYRYTCDDLRQAAQALSDEVIRAEPRYEIWLAALARDTHDHADQIRLWLGMYPDD